jgi:Tfp pilus assembly protein FimT
MALSATLGESGGRFKLPGVAMLSTGSTCTRRRFPIEAITSTRVNGIARLPRGAALNAVLSPAGPNVGAPDPHRAGTALPSNGPTSASSRLPRTSERSLTLGFTTLELLAVLAVLGILLGIGAASLAPPRARVAAASLQSVILQARFLALKANRPVVVVLDPEAGYLTARTGTMAGVIDCEPAGTPTRTLDLTEYGHLRVSATASVFVWLPNGQVRGCGGEWLTDPVSITLHDGRAQHAVIVGMGGEVSLR